MGERIRKKIKMFKLKTIMILMSIMKLLKLIKIHQINNIRHIILGSITNKDLLILVLYVHMKFLIRQTKSTCVVIDLIVNTLNTTPIVFTNSKYQFYKVTQDLHKKMTVKITLEPFVFCLHHGVQFLTSN